METLRTELIETQKVRSDLMKWKLLIVAAIGGSALGFSGSGDNGQNNACLALAIIPLACFYVDLLCRHLSLRNKAIGKFIASHDSGDEVLKNYENFYDRISRDVWDLVSFESVALVGCTVFLSIAIVPIGVLASSAEPCWGLLAWPASLFYGAAITGLILSIWLQTRYTRCKSKMDNLITPDESKKAI